MSNYCLVVQCQKRLKDINLLDSTETSMNSNPDTNGTEEVFVRCSTFRSGNACKRAGFPQYSCACAHHSAAHVSSAIKREGAERQRERERERERASVGASGPVVMSASTSRRGGKTTMLQPFPRNLLEKWKERTEQSPNKG